MTKLTRNLIAAAPEMLNACLGALEALDGDRNEVRRHVAIMDLRAAIAKAEGRMTTPESACEAALTESA